MELMIAIAITSITVVGAFLVMSEGLKLYRTNKRAADAQTDVLQVLSRVTTEAVNAKQELVRIYPGGAEPEGIVFASPLLETGQARIDDLTAELYWQFLVAYYFVPGAPGLPGKVYRAHLPIPSTAGDTPPGSKDVAYVESLLDSRTTSFFQSGSGVQRRALGHDISAFDVALYSGEVDASAGVVVHDSYTIAVAAGDKTDRSSTGYYIKVDSRVTPRG